MPRLDYKTCKGCGRKSAEVGPLSCTRLCADCGRRRLEENMDGIHTFTGEPALRWRRRMAASVGAILLEDLDALARQD